MDVISRLEGFPYVLENIFQYFDTATVLVTENVSRTWKRLITSLNLWKCVWKTNVRMSLTWKTLSVRMEDLQPQLWHRMKKDNASSYREACQYMEENFRQISQSSKKNLHLQALKNEDEDEDDEDECSEHIYRLNEKYVFISLASRVRIFNRWTKQLVKEFLCHIGQVVDMQLTERFLAVQRYSRTVSYDQIDVYDVLKLVHIQTLKIERNQKKLVGSWATKFGLGSDVLVFSRAFRHEDHLMIRVHRWNPSAARFICDTETEHRLEADFSDYKRFVHLDIMYDFYVDDKYLIFDFDSVLREDMVRRIQVLSLETMQPVRERQFADGVYRGNIRKEYHDGGIVVQSCTADGLPCVALWDVDMDTVQPIADHPKRFDYSFAMAHHRFQVVVVEKRGLLMQSLLMQSLLMQSLLIQRGQPTSNSVVAIPSECSFYDLNFNCRHFYYDGLQMLAESHFNEFDQKCEVFIVDLIG